MWFFGGSVFGDEVLMSCRFRVLGWGLGFRV